MPPGSRTSPPSRSARARHSLGFSLILLKYRDSAPTLGAIDMPLSFSTTTSGVPKPPAWPIASNATPPVMAPSPITATTFASASAAMWRIPSLMPTA